MASEQLPHQAETVTLNKMLKPLNWEDMTRPEDYVAWDNDLIAAANVALALGKPLLLTGAPGVGKSEFARWLAYELELGDCEKFVVKSTTESNDLFYHYDSLGRFHDAQVGHKLSGEQANSDQTTTASSQERQLRYLKFQALGIAILNSLGREKAINLNFVDQQASGAIAALPRRTVVLIDEIDKAPRDVPNDMLDEIDKMTFAVKEISGAKIQADTTLRPVVVITSNSEKDLPEPFLRRCIYYHIPFPENKAALQRILLSRLRERMAETSPLLADAQQLFHYLRTSNIPLQRKPGLAELLDWLYALTRNPDHREQRLQQLPHEAGYVAAKTTLLKHAEDQKKVTKDLWQEWLKSAGLVDGKLKP